MLAEHSPPLTRSGPAHSKILVTTPAPTVLPPSRMANRRLSCMAIGVWSSTVILMLSPGMHISASLLSSDSRLRTEPVTSVVRK